MVIVINTGITGTSFLFEAGICTYEMINKIAGKNTEHLFVLIFNGHYNKKIVFAPNIKPLIVNPPANHSLLSKLWCSIKIPAILKREKADVFVSYDIFCPVRTSIPQCVVIQDLSFLRFPSFFKKAQLQACKKNMPKFLEKAKTIVVLSDLTKNDILDTYNIADDRIDVVYNAAGPAYSPVNPDEKKRIKEKFTESREYFLYTGSLHPRNNLLNLLKAFSLFKKRQQTAMKLVLAVSTYPKNDSFIKSLETYKYRNDVLLIKNPDEEEKALLTAAAYAITYPAFFLGLGVQVQEAIQSGVPVITSADTSMQEIAKQAALYVNPSDINDIAEKMMMIYKDETLRKKLVENTKDVALLYSQDKTASLMWESILKACNK